MPRGAEKIYIWPTLQSPFCIQFAVSEEELWRAVLLWAKRGSGVNKPTNQWTEEDNDKIREVRNSDQCIFKSIK